MHLIDTLDAGGAERVAVNIVNHLPRERFSPHLCTTRRDGILDGAVVSDVGRLRLTRKWRFDSEAIRRLRAYARDHKIQVLHVHGTSLFAGVLGALFSRGLVVVWHDHFGNYLVQERPAWLYRLACRRVGGVIAVNEALAEWARKRLGVGTDRVWNLPNFVSQPYPAKPVTGLPGSTGSRIVCVANFRQQKDHINLVRAMALVTRQIPEAHLLLVGETVDPNYFAEVQKEIKRLELTAHVSLLGQRLDVSDVLRSCDVGVLGSASEGLPLALIEYGMAGLATVVTNVGQCADVVDQGRAGQVVPAGTPDALAAAMVSLLNSPQQRSDVGERLQRRVLEMYSAGPVIEQIGRIYEFVLGRRTE